VSEKIYTAAHACQTFQSGFFDNMSRKNLYGMRKNLHQMIRTPMVLAKQEECDLKDTINVRFARILMRPICTFVLDEDQGVLGFILKLRT
jgi:hypothetical protein